jgi:DMSO/TMAO reductase YedYZ molybdopterin-dependent catalytic subunit
MSYTRALLALTVLAGLVLAQAPATAVLSVQGDVASPLSLSADDLAKMPRQTVSLPNPDGSKTVYQGVTLFAVLEKAGVPTGEKLRGKALTTYILAKAQDGYQVAFTLGELDPQFGNQAILVADTRDGKPLPEKTGPLRLVCPNDHAGARSVRMLQTLEVVRLAK